MFGASLQELIKVEMKYYEIKLSTKFGTNAKYTVII